nr:uncharacterized protein LOC109742408 [Aegilops tauschii subsp. strangulata]
MRREGRQRGWVRVYDRELVDPEGKRRAVHAVEGPAVANGGFIRAPRKPTNQSKSGGLRALGRSGIAQEEKEEEPQALPPTMAARFGYYYSTGLQSPFKFESAMYTTTRKWRSVRRRQRASGEDRRARRGASSGTTRSRSTTSTRPTSSMGSSIIFMTSIRERSERRCIVRSLCQQKDFCFCSSSST